MAASEPATVTITEHSTRLIFFMSHLISEFLIFRSNSGDKIVAAVLTHGGHKGRYSTGQIPPGCPVQPACPGPVCALLRPLFAGITYGKELLNPSVLVLTPSPRANPYFVESTRMPSMARREMSNT